MKTQFRTVASIVALGLFASASGSVLADSLETQYSVYHLAAQANQVQAQAGPAGPSRIPGSQAVSNWPTETQFSVYHLASLHNDAPAAQAGRAGPTSTVQAASDWPTETQFSVYHLANRL